MPYRTDKRTQYWLGRTADVWAEATLTDDPQQKARLLILASVYQALADEVTSFQGSESLIPLDRADF
jgi:hypothetical protein